MPILTAAKGSEIVEIDVNYAIEAYMEAGVEAGVCDPYKMVASAKRETAERPSHNVALSAKIPSSGKSKGSSLRWLDLSCCGSLTDELLSRLVSSLPRLYALNLSGCRKIGRLTSMSLARANICYLVLRDCHELVDADLHYIGQAKSLRELDLSGCGKLTGGILSHLNKVAGGTSVGETGSVSKQSLRRLFLGSVDKLEDEDLFVMNTLDLEELDVAGCRRLTPRGGIATLRDSFIKS